MLTGKTPLTEAQARALAHWWGGGYHWVAQPGPGADFWHGVVVGHQGRKECLPPESPQIAVFSLEEVQVLENFRDAVNPGTRDWVP